MGKEFTPDRENKKPPSTDRKPTKTQVPCGASVDIGEEYLHIRGCPQCQQLNNSKEPR